MDTKDGVTVLPDGSAFFTASFPLPKDHWIYEKDADGFLPEAPTPRVVIIASPGFFAETIRQAGRYAVRCATRGGTVVDFDPDALVQSLVFAMVGHGDSGVTDASGRVIAPPQPAIVARPSGPWDGNGKA